MRPRKYTCTFAHAHKRGWVNAHKMSAVQVMAQSGVGGAADRTPFFGIKVPQEVKKLVQISKTLDAAVFKNIVKCEGLGTFGVT